MLIFTVLGSGFFAGMCLEIRPVIFLFLFCFSMFSRLSLGSVEPTCQGSSFAFYRGYHRAYGLSFILMVWVR